MLDGSSTQIKSISRVFCWTGLRCHSDCGFDAAPDSSIWTYHLSLCLRTDLAFVLPTHSVNVESALLLLFWVFRLLGHVLQLLRTPTATPVFFASEHVFAIVSWHVVFGWFVSFQDPSCVKLLDGVARP